MRNSGYTFFVLVLICGILQGQTATSIVYVKYVSADHVYLDGGSSSGITVGQECKIIRDDSTFALIKVVFVAGRSASCEIIFKKGPVKIGDSVVYIKTLEKKKDQSVKESRKRSIAKKHPERKPIKTKIAGRLSLQWNQYSDLRNHRYNFNQPGLRFSLSARNLWGKEYNLRIKFRSRYYSRRRRPAGNIPQKEWRNRLYEVSFSYDKPTALINYKAGRIISSAFSGVGYIDGLLVQHNVLKGFKWGVFAGTQPTWQYSKFQTSIQKYGAFTKFSPSVAMTRRFESVLAFVGEYHGSTVSREFISLKNSFSEQKRFSLYQSMELDINRNWRKKQNGNSINLSGLYLNGRYYLSRDFSMAISYDNRRNYMTYRMRSLADSLFDEAARQGLRTSVNYRFLNRYQIMANIGSRWRDNQKDPSFAYSAGFTARNLFNKGLTISARYSGFSNLYTKGSNPSLAFYKYFGHGHFLQLNYGNYSYHLKGSSPNRLNHWLRINNHIELPFKLFTQINYEYHWGDDKRGHLVFSELGYRF